MVELWWRILNALPLMAAFCGAAVLLGTPLSGLLKAPSDALERFLERPLRGYLVIGLVALLIPTLSTAWTGVPIPTVHDEFSYLLAADTFAHGRITNPTPPFAEHYETFHVLMRPTYMSKYPPAQGLFLAIGRLLWHPILGVWLGGVLASLASYGMLRVWFANRSQKWAFIGGVIVTLHPAIIRWEHSYWGGCVAVFAGALFLGNARFLLYALESREALEEGGIRLPILLAEPAERLRSIRWHSVGMGAGVWALANSRPYEGAVLTFCTLIASIRPLLRRASPRCKATERACFAPLALCLLLMSLQIGYYNYRITGSPLRLPYIEHERAYGAAPQLSWQSPPKPVAYSHVRIERFYHTNDSRQYHILRTRKGFLRFNYARIASILSGFYNPIALVIMLAALPITLRRSANARLALSLMAITLFASLFEKSHFLHYSAPVMCLYLYVMMDCLRECTQWRWQGRTAVFLILIAQFAPGFAGDWVIRFLAAPTRAMAVSMCFYLIVIIYCTLEWRRRTSGKPLALMALIALICYSGEALSTLPAAESNTFSLKRFQLERKLRKSGGQHLILVRYADKHDLNWEWIYNDADIEHATIVWALDRGVEGNRALREHFQNRKVWLFEAEEYSWLLMPY